MYPNTLEMSTLGYCSTTKLSEYHLPFDSFLSSAWSHCDYLAFGECTPYNVPTHVAAWAAGAGEIKIFVGNISTVMPLQTGDVEQHDFVIYIEGAECNAAASITPKAVFPITTTAAGNVLIDPGPSRSYTIVYGVESDPNWVCIDNV